MRILLRASKPRVARIRSMMLFASSVVGGIRELRPTKRFDATVEAQDSLHKVAPWGGRMDP